MLIILVLGQLGDIESTLRGLPSMTSAKISDFWTPPPPPVTYMIKQLISTVVAFSNTPPPPLPLERGRH